MPTLVGHVAAVMRYPVKSMAGEPRDAADIGWSGLVGDRQWAWLKAGDLTRFPWFTARELSSLLLYRAAYDDPADPRRSAVTVTDGEETWRIDDAALKARLEAAAGYGLTLLQLGRGAHDAMPVSILSTGSLAALEAAHGSALDPRRFRSNIVVESATPEGEWPGRHVSFGTEGAALLLADGAPRCAMVTIDPDTAARTPAILRTVAQCFDNRFATYASVARPGAIRVGDPVWVA